MTLLHELARHAAGDPDAIAIEVLDGDGQPATTCSYGELVAGAAGLARALRDRFPAGDPPHKFAIAAANGPPWVIADLALQLLGWTSVPLALEFSADQAAALLAGAAAVLVDGTGDRVVAAWGAACDAVRVDEAGPACSRADAARVWQQAIAELAASPDRIAKIIHTSGTTTLPKGVRTRASALELQRATLARDLADATARYCCFVPLSLLDEQLFAIHLTLSTGGTLVLPPRDVRPFVGGTTRARDYLPWIRRARPSMFLGSPPAIVEALELEVRALRTGGLTAGAVCARVFGTEQVPVIGCGGAPLDEVVLHSLAASGIVVYEGYGLSEAASVVAWNRPGAYRFGTVGQPPAHTMLALAADGELLVKTPTLFAGYDGEDTTSLAVRDGWLHTGDLAAIDDDGFVRITGRKKNVLIFSTGRNVCPEHVEAVYRSHALIEHIAVFGDRREQLVAVVIPRDDHCDRGALARAMLDAPRALADHERVQRYVVLDRGEAAPFFTVTGRPSRDRLWQFVHPLFEELAV